MSRLTLKNMTDWLQAQATANYTDKILVAYARQPDMPDRCVTVMQIGTTQEIMDGAFEEVPMRLVTRGRSESIDDAENIAYWFDELIYDIQNDMLGDIYVTSAQIMHSPKLISMTDKQSRYQFTADYKLTASRYN